jgi:thiosulfate dehydrogenase [quinone] large subunit
MFRGEAWACFFLRMWIGMRLLFAGLTKWKGKNEETGLSEFSPSHGTKVMENITGVMKANTPIPEKMLDYYATVLPWALVITGVWVIIGLFTRISLIAAGAVILSLSFGLMLLPDDVDAVRRGVELIVIALALVTVKHNILAVDNIVEMAIGKSDDKDSPKEKD